MKKYFLVTIYILLPFIIILIISLFGFMVTKKDIYKDVELRKNINQISSHRETPDTLFTDYENLDRKFCGLKLKREIDQLKFEGEIDNVSIKNYKDFPDYAGYYVPKNLVDSVANIDIDNDKKLETVVYYTCRGCNAPSRAVDIIKDNKIIFTAKGGNLEIKTIKNEAGFILNTSGLALSMNDGYTVVKFKKSDSGEFNTISEEDIKY